MCWEFISGLHKTEKVSKKPSFVYPFENLNHLYKDEGLQFDQYGNPIYLNDVTDPAKDKL